MSILKIGLRNECAEWETDQKSLFNEIIKLYGFTYALMYLHLKCSKTTLSFYKM